MSHTPAAPTNPTEPTLSTPEQPIHRDLFRRGLFRYHDGFRDRLADVIEVQFRIQDALQGGDMSLLDELFEAVAPRSEPVKPESPEAEPAPSGLPAGPVLTVVEAMIRLARLVTVGFDLPPLDEATERGLSVQERVDLIADFMSMAPAPADHQGDDESSVASSDQAEMSAST